MSRTRRIKNYAESHNDSYDRKGKKIALEYTVVVWGAWTINDDGSWTAYSNSYREPTKAERYDKDQRMHGESKHDNVRGPSRMYRKWRSRENRQLTKREIHRYMMIPDYEPMVETEPRSCLYDWD